MATRIEIDKRIDVAESLLVLCKPIWQVERELARKYKVSTRQAREYIRRVRERWKRESGTLDREARRDAMRASVSMIFEKSMALEKVLIDRKGKPIKKPKTKKLMTIPTPDLECALRAGQVLIQLDGLQGPAQIEVKGDVTLADLAEKAERELKRRGEDPS